MKKPTEAETMVQKLREELANRLSQWADLIELTLDEAAHQVKLAICKACGKNLKRRIQGVVRGITRRYEWKVAYA